MITAAKNGQCLADVALTVCGSVEGVWALALRNGLGVTDDLTVGQEIWYEPEDVTDARVAARYAAEGIMPAGAISDAEVQLLKQMPRPKRWQVHEIVNTDAVESQSTRAAVHSGEFTATFA